jgi:hypothetical protein
MGAVVPNKKKLTAQIRGRQITNGILRQPQAIFTQNFDTPSV